MTIGTFGDTVFEVSSFKVLTVDGVKRTTKHRYAKHDVMNHKPRLESVGADLTEIEMQVDFHRDLGVEVAAEANNLRQKCTNAVAEDLIMGNEVIGTFIIEEMTESTLRTDGAGRPLHISASVKFKEYV